MAPLSKSLVVEYVRDTVIETRDLSKVDEKGTVIPVSIYGGTIDPEWSAGLWVPRRIFWMSLTLTRSYQITTLRLAHGGRGNIFLERKFID